MVRISIQAAHEQANPLDLLNDVIRMDEKRIEKCWVAIITSLGGILVHLEVLLGLGLELL
jgi:predicted transposase YbfD/YdcC